MPTDGLAFAVFVRRQIQVVGVLELVLEQLDLLRLARRDDVDRREIVVDVHAQVGPLLALVLRGNLLGALRQVADVADAGLDACNPLPRNLPIVRALAGDSTMTSARPPPAGDLFWPCIRRAELAGEYVSTLVRTDSALLTYSLTHHSLPASSFLLRRMPRTR